MMPICVLDFANRGYKRCLHMICFNVSFALYIFPSALCASYFVIGFWRISIVSGLSSLEFLSDRCAEMFVFKQFCFARPTDSDESTALHPLITDFLLVEEVVDILFDCLHRILCFDFLVVIGRAYEIQIVKHLDDHHFVSRPINF